MASGAAGKVIKDSFDQACFILAHFSSLLPETPDADPISVDQQATLATFDGCSLQKLVVVTGSELDEELRSIEHISSRVETSPTFVTSKRAPSRYTILLSPLKRRI